ncbi:MAG TPA: hypothetical protein VFA93_02455 [Patescibacteria group bacterium]|nr:hypothetical protein [Patescibacteria group bacterium]
MIFFFLFLFLLLQASFISLPLVFLFLIPFAIRYKNAWVILLAFFLGILLDSFSLRTLGGTSLFLLGFLFAVSLYERKFEIENFSFILVASFLGSFFFFILFDNSHVLFKSFVSSIVCLLISGFILKPRGVMNG